MKEKKSPIYAIVLAGGGARGAYEAGVVEYILSELPAEVIDKISFRIICGTSVGALNSCFMAAAAHDKRLQSRILSDTWESLTIDQVYDFSWNEVKRLPRFLKGSGGMGSLDDLGRSGRKGGVFNTAPLERLMRTGIDWQYIQRNLDEDCIDAVVVNALHLGSGETHSFLQTRQSIDQRLMGVHRRMIPTILEAKHALASSAIPWIFPAVEIEHKNYVDGSLRMNTPISPAIHLGADKIFVIGLSGPEAHQPHKQPIDQFPSALTILDRIASALLHDSTESDITRLNQINEIIRVGTDAFGAEFVEVLNKATGRSGDKGYRPIDTFYVNPSKNIAELAADYVQNSQFFDGLTGFMRLLVERIAFAALEDPSSMTLSSILFDGGFANLLIELGKKDAAGRRDELIEFFTAA